MLNTLKINYMFATDTCTNLITHLVSYVTLITIIIKCKYVPLIWVHTRISILLCVYPCSISYMQNYYLKKWGVPKHPWGTMLSWLLEKDQRLFLVTWRAQCPKGVSEHPIFNSDLSCCSGENI